VKTRRTLVNVTVHHEAPEGEVLREGARRMLAAAVDADADLQGPKANGAPSVRSSAATEP